MRIICTPLYSATEGFFGVNMNPSLPPEETFYVLVPTVAYYEFIAIGPPKRYIESADSVSSKVHPTHDKDEDALVKKGASATADGEEQVLDLASLVVGQQYEILVTTVSGGSILHEQHIILNSSLDQHIYYFSIYQFIVLPCYYTTSSVHVPFGIGTGLSFGILNFMFDAYSNNI